MIDSFPFESWLDAEGNFNQSITSFWPYAGDAALTESLTDASTGTWTLTIIGILVTITMLVGWIVYEYRVLNRATERLRAQGKWAPRA